MLRVNKLMMIIRNNGVDGNSLQLICILINQEELVM